MTATTTTTQPIRHRQRQGGPSLLGLGVVSLVLFLASLVISTAMAGRTYPSPFASASTILGYFRDHEGAVRAGAFLQFASGVPLLIYAATASARLRNLGIRAPGATIALAGGILSAGLLGLSALTSWTLSQPTVSSVDGVVRALHSLAFATGGPGFVVPFGLLIAGMAVPAAFGRLLPRGLWMAGLAVAVLAEVSTLSLVANGADFLLPIARFGGLGWMIGAGALLPTRRSASAAEATS
ncbi:MAG: hypothetical protein JO337_13015 [Acidimicrobiales bacterium]|nr:hypothetical protein [Acidimicrobiales bacterium]